MCPDGKIDNLSIVGDQLSYNPVIIALLIALIFSIALFNGFGCSVTKYASAASRATIDVARTGIIWLFFLVVPLGAGNGETFKWL